MSQCHDFMIPACVWQPRIYGVTELTIRACDFTLDNFVPATLYRSNTLIIALIPSDQKLSALYLAM